MDRFLEVAAENAAKRLLVKFAGGRNPQTLEIMPGTTTRELVRHLGLGEGYEVSDENFSRVFNQNEVLYPHVQDGGALHVSSRVDAGC